jgi:tight adherence protein C
MLLLIGVLAFITLFVFLYLVLASFLPAQQSVAVRLRALDAIMTNRSDIDEELAKPFTQRVIAPIAGGLSGWFMRLTPRSIQVMVDEKIAAAGGFKGLGTKGFLGLCGFLAIAFPLVAVFMAVLLKVPQKAMGLGMIAFALGIALPFLLLRRKIAARKVNIQKALPDVLDLLTVSIEAGLGFDAALAKLAEKMKGDLVEEFNRVLQEIRIAVPRRDALHAMGLRCDVPDLSLFTTALVQADQLGVSISNVLRVQSVAMRDKRRQRAQEQAMKAPVKMLLPLVFFIFPTIFIILLGPAVIQIFTTMIQR